MTRPTMAEDILARLVAFPSVAGRPNGEIVAWIASYAESHGARVEQVPGPEGDRANLLLTLGDPNQAGLVLSGHMDVVPAEEEGWSSDPFTLRRDGERLYGRGASDMKGFLACALASLPALARLAPKVPVHLAFSYDEEIGCRGVPHLIAALPQLCARPFACIVGEPSGLRAIRAHKGKAAARLTIRGRAGHSSRPDLGLNAIHAAGAILEAAVRAAEALRDGPSDANFEPSYSSLQVGRILGGQAVNIVPDLCRMEVEARAIAGVSPTSLLEPLRAALLELEPQGFTVEWEETSAYPALSLAADAPLAHLMRDVTGEEPLAAVSYGTEAGLYAEASIPSIIWGPGDIGRAHKADEYIERGELAACCATIAALGQRLSA